MRQKWKLIQSNQRVVVSPEGYTDAFRDNGGVASIMYASKIGIKNSVNIVRNRGGERMMSN